MLQYSIMFRFTFFLFDSKNTIPNSLPMDCYLDVVGGLVPLRFEEGRPKVVRDKVSGKGQKQYY
jgi:hypothetical protein